ncbi:MFS transporter [Streptomyces sannanensis]
MGGRVLKRPNAVLLLLVYCGLSNTVISSLGGLLVPSIARTHHVPVSTAQWVLTVNLLAGVVTTPVLGRLADGCRSRRALLAALVLVVSGSVLAAMAGGLPQLLIGRALQGPACGMLPMTIALAHRHLAPARVPEGIVVLTVAAATGSGISYPLTGLIADCLDYHWAFWFAVAFVAPAVAGVLLILPPDKGPAADRGADAGAPSGFKRADPVGAVLLTAGLACLLLVVSKGSSWGWTSVAALGPLAGSAALIPAWAWWERRAAQPLIRPDLLLLPDVLLANITAVVLGATTFVGYSAIGMLAQVPPGSGYGLGLSVFTAGCVMLPLSAGSQLAGRLTRRLTARMGHHGMLPLGGALVAGANAGLVVHHDRLWHLLLAMLAFGVGSSIIWAVVPTLIHTAVPGDDLGTATSFNHVLRVAGSAIGSAATGAILDAYASSDGFPTEEGYVAVFSVSAISCTAVLLGLLGRVLAERRRAEGSQLPG